MKIKMLAKSDVGKQREINEDYWGIFEEENLAILCDGMGGHNAGAHASRLAVSTIRYMFHFLDEDQHLTIASDLHEDYPKIAARLVSSIRLANRHIFNRAIGNKKYRGMGTTVSALAIRDETVCICHVGDSRVYRLRDQQIELLTQDHSWLNELIQDHEIDEAEALKFEKKNVITRALGLAPSVKIDVKIESAKTGDLFLLCSDGLTGGVSQEEILQIISENRDSLNTAADQLIDFANLVDGSDNITITLVEIVENHTENETINPVNMTLKPEDEAVIMMENKILKYEFYGSSLFDKAVDKLKVFWGKTYFKLIFVTTLIFFTIIFVKYISTDNVDPKSHSPAQVIPDLKNKSQQNSQSGKTTRMNSANKNKRIRSTEATFYNTILDTEKIHTRSLHKTLNNRGLIYLVGLEEELHKKNSYIYLNQKFIGSTYNFLENGIKVEPGKYEIAIKDSNNNILLQLPNIFISSGDIKAIELAPYPKSKP